MLRIGKGEKKVQKTQAVAPGGLVFFMYVQYVCGHGLRTEVQTCGCLIV